MRKQYDYFWLKSEGQQNRQSLESLMNMYFTASWLIFTTSAYLTASSVAEKPGTNSRSEVASGCRLPSQPLYGNYTSLLCVPGDRRATCSNAPDTLVPTGWVLKYRCDTGYVLPVNNTNYSVCNNGVWRSSLDCIKLCPPLLSVSVVVRCTFNGQQIPCDKPMRPNSTAFARCSIQQYREAYRPYFTDMHCQADGEWSSDLFSCEPDCGFANLTHSTNISSEPTETPQEAIPWLAAIFLRDTETDRWEQQCGGTLISRHVVLTAAHCLTTAEVEPVLPGNIRVGLGKLYRDYYNNENNSIIADVRAVVIPPHYSGGVSSYTHDIGLVDLATSVQFTLYISPACFDWSSTIKFNSAVTGHVAGWGKTGLAAASETAVASQLAFIEHHSCTSKARQVMRNFITADKLCAESLNGSHEDQSDSGGGVTVVKNGQHYVVGTVSTKVTGTTSLTVITDMTNTEHHFWIEREAARFDEYHQSEEVAKGDLLIIDRRRGIVRIPLDPKRRESALNTVNSDNIRDFAVDCATGDIYWIDIERKYYLIVGIRRTDERGLNFTTFLNESTSGIRGMTVDWIGRKLYWTDSVSDLIRAASLENGEVETIVTSRNPKNIAVHPGRRKLYWSRRVVGTDESLESSNLDGSGGEVLARIDKGVDCLVIDWTTEELCWCEPASMKIECLNLDSGKRRTAVTNCDTSSLIITPDKYYWIRGESVVGASKVSPSAAALPLHLPFVKSASGVKSIAIHNSCPTLKKNYKNYFSTNLEE